MSIVEETRVASEEREYFESYRAISSSAVASCVIGALAAGNLLSFEYGIALGLLPILAILLGGYGLWSVSRNSEELTGKRMASAGLLMGVVFLATGWGFAGFVYATEVPEGYERITYQELQPDPATPEQIMPPSAAELDGKRVFIKGYVYPGKQQRGIKQFVLCRDNGQCCFGGQPKLTDMILVDLAGDLRLEYSTRLRRLAGTFKVQPSQGTDGLGTVLYQLEADYLQ